ncbi:hypothetical protein PG997_001692 [Apiospora hydei]|uniref:Uncharacterized protein n=1 Tax=Apiospora hydei TaxID=1337664 RepID=A0ABR1XE91_9PEZI
MKVLKPKSRPYPIGQLEVQRWGCGRGRGAREEVPGLGHPRPHRHAGSSTHFGPPVSAEGVRGVPRVPRRAVGHGADRLHLAHHLGVWGFDRLVARPVRIVRDGLRREAEVSVLDSDYLMIRVPGVKDAEGYAYPYFPSLSWRVWENHPFSVAAVGGYHPGKTRASALSNWDSDSSLPGPGENNGPNADEAATEQTDPPNEPGGIVFFVRRRGGQRLRVLVKSSYGTTASSSSSGPRFGLGLGQQRLRKSYPNLICVAGGVRITALLPLVKGSSASSGNTELY